MLQEVIGNKQIKPSLILKPNINKIMLKTLRKIIGIVFLIETAIFLFQWKIGFGIFGEALGIFGINANSRIILFVALFSIVIIALLVLLGAYLAAINFRYEFYNDKLIAYETLMMIMIRSKEISYDNIVRILYRTSGFISEDFSGVITLYLSGTDRSKIEVKFIDNVKQAAETIHGLIARSRQAKQAQPADLNIVAGRFLIK